MTLHRMRIPLTRHTAMTSELDPRVMERIRAAILEFEAQGPEVIQVDIDLTIRAMP